MRNEIFARKSTFLCKSAVVVLSCIHNNYLIVVLKPQENSDDEYFLLLKKYNLKIKHNRSRNCLRSTIFKNGF